MLLMALIILSHLSLQSLNVCVEKVHVGVFSLVYGLAPLVKVVFVRATQGIDSFSLSLRCKIVALFATLFRLPVKPFFCNII